MKGNIALLKHVTEQMKDAGFDTKDEAVQQVIQYSLAFAFQELEYDMTKREGWTDDGPRQLIYEGREDDLQ